MKKIIISTFLLLSVLSLQAQTFQWAHSAGSDVSTYASSHEHVINICTDSGGNIYYGIEIGGHSNIWINDTLSFMPDEGTNLGLGVAIVCCNCAGELLWYRTFYCDTYRDWSDVWLSSFNLVNDTTLLFTISADVNDDLLMCDDSGHVDTIQDEAYYKIMWLNTKTRHLEKCRNHSRYINDAQIVNDRLYMLSGIDSNFIYVYDTAGERLSRTPLDMGAEYQSTGRTSIAGTIQFQVYHGKYYFLLSGAGYCSLYLGTDTIAASDAVHLACYDSTGRCLWHKGVSSDGGGYIEMINQGRNLCIDQETGTIYIGFTGYNKYVVADSTLHVASACVVLCGYDTLGNNLFIHHTTGNGYSFVEGMNVLPGNKVAVGGRCYGYQTFDNMDSVTGNRGFIYLYDGNSGRFIASVAAPAGRMHGVAFTTFHTDNDGNLLFGGKLWQGSSGIFGADTLHARNASYSSFYGKYGWPCDSTTHWHDPVGIAAIPALTPLRLYPNPATDQVCIDLPTEYTTTQTATAMQTATATATQSATATDEARVVYVADKSDRCRIRICNMLGQCLVEQTLSADESETRLSLKALPKGVYMVEYRTNSRLTAVQKLVKQ
jgi:hypothetical protein